VPYIPLNSVFAQKNNCHSSIVFTQPNSLTPSFKILSTHAETTVSVYDILQQLIWLRIMKQYVVLGRLFSQNFGFPYHFSFHQLIHIP
jgi:hypothetical protein